MIKLITTIAILLVSALSFSQSIEGSWNGLLDVQGIKLKIIFNISSKDGKLVSTLDSPDQGAKGIPVETTTFGNNVLEIGMLKPKMSYIGKPNADFSEIEGTFTQNTIVIPLKLSKKEIEKAIVVRPQTPKPPFLYNEEEITFDNKKDNIKLAGTFTFPKSKGVFPVVIMITGSGPQNRDEEILNHKPFAVIADDLTKKGIAVLRFDDRGVGKSTGKFAEATSADFVTDVEAAIDFLKTRKEVNLKKIGLIGHSEGGMIAPMVASKSKDISFIVLMAGPGTSIDELMIEQNTRALKLSGANDSYIKETTDLYKTIYAFIKQNDSENLKPKIIEFVKSELSKSPDNKSLTKDRIDELAEQLGSSFSGKWFQYFIKYNPADSLLKVKCPVLAINGSLDFQVPATENLKAIEVALRKAGNKNFKIIELPDLNHLFQEATTGALNEYSKIEQTIAPVALTVMSDWIMAQTKK
jgi:uncharacterized protein